MSKKWFLRKKDTMYQINLHSPVHIYFIGIGGISMSGLAQILLEDGFKISGSDTQKSPLTATLEEKGATIYYGQRAGNIKDGIDVVVYTAAIHADNVEMTEVASRKLPILTRAQLLGQIMKNYQIPIAISGTHGKTSTTSMVSHVLLAANVNPTLSIGGVLKAIHGNVRVGGNEYFVTEACEYTDSFLNFFPKIALILNVEEDHLDYFKDILQIRDSFQKFAALLPSDGCLIINGNIDHYEELTEGLPCKVITYGSSNCDYVPTNIIYDEFARPTFTLTRKDSSSSEFSLGVTGEHNVYNALATIALSEYLGIESSYIKEALSLFQGTDRRFEYKGLLGGVTIIDDYAHHPTEILATLQAASHYPHRDIWCVFQPHTYTRTKAFLKEFAVALSRADHVVLADIYAAREVNTSGVTSLDLQKELLLLGVDAHYFSSFDEIENFLLVNCIPKDLLITMGAGDVVKIGENLLGI